MARAAAPLATVTATSTPAPTPTPVVVNGWLRDWRASDGCQGDAVLTDCSSPTVTYVLRAPAGTDLVRYVGQKAQIEGLVRDCGAAGVYVAVSKVTPLDKCESPVPSQPANLALGKPAVTDERQGSLQGFGPERVTDGDAATYWYYPASSADAVTWIRLDLGAEVPFNVVRLRWGASYASQFAIYVWNPRYGPNGSWVPLHDQQHGKGGDESLTLARVSGRFVLVYLKHSAGAADGYQLREWEIYNQSSPNLVLGQGKNVRVSSAQGGYGGELAVDGSVQFGWACSGGDPKPYVVARLPATHAVTDYRLIWRWPAIPAVYRAVFYRGAEPYVQTSPQISRESIHTLSWRVPFDADAFGVFAESVANETGYIELLEMELYGPDSGSGLPLLAGVERGGGLGLDLSLRRAVERATAPGAQRSAESVGSLKSLESLEPVPPGVYPRLGGEALVSGAAGASGARR